MQIDKDVLAIVNEGQIDPEIVVQVNKALERIKNPDNAYETIEFNIKPLLIENGISIDDIISLISNDARKRLGQVFKTKKYTDDDLSAEFKDVHKMESLNEAEKMINAEIYLELFDQRPFKTSIQVDTKDGKFKTSVHNPRVLGKDTVLEADTLIELIGAVRKYFESIDYDVKVDKARGGYADLDAADPQIEYRDIFTAAESKNEADVSTLNDLKAEVKAVIAEAKQLIVSKLETAVKEIKDSDLSQAFEIMDKAVNSRAAVNNISSIVASTKYWIDYIDRAILANPDQKEELEARLAHDLKTEIKQIKAQLERI